MLNMLHASEALTGADDNRLALLSRIEIKHQIMHTSPPASEHTSISVCSGVSVSVVVVDGVAYARWAW